jgi:hypothetical protein
VVSASPRCPALGLLRYDVSHLDRWLEWRSGPRVGTHECAYGVCDGRGLVFVWC